MSDELREDFDINCEFLHGFREENFYIENGLDECLSYLSSSVRKHPDVQALVEELTTIYKRQMSKHLSSN